MVEKMLEVSDGPAMAIVKGPAKRRVKVVITKKTGRIATKAVQAWIILDGQGALLLLSPEKKASPNRLRHHQFAGTPRTGRPPRPRHRQEERVGGNGNAAHHLGRSL